MVIYPESFSVKPNIEATVGFRNLFNTTSQTAVNKNLTLLKGNYVFCSKNANLCKMHVSNTMSAEEYGKINTKNIHKAAVVIENVKNMDIDCGRSNFIMDGKMTHIYIKNCENIKIKNLNIQTILPNVHIIKILKASSFYVTFEIDSQSDFIEENGAFYWVGTDYKLGFTDYKNSGEWVPTAKPDNPLHFKRNGSHPLFGVSAIKQISDRVFNARFIVPKDFEVGQIFYIYPAMREEVGIFVEGSKNIVFENVKQRFNHSLAFVAQNSENITLDGVDFSPNPKAEVDFCCVADFVHFSMCRGKLKVINSSFDACGNDVCNVHGFNFEIVESNKDKMRVKFPHPASYGFECLREGDIIAFIDPKTLLEVGRTKLLHAELRDEYYYDLVLTTYDPAIGEGGFVECVSANPDFEFSNNTLNRSAGNGVLCTTRGKIRIENNKVLNTGECGICIYDDATETFESGPVEDVIISNNAFMNCEGNAILINPNNKKSAGPVHRNIDINNNLFVLNNIHALNVSDSENILMQHNVYKGKALNNQWVVSANTKNLVTDCPK